MTFVFDKNYRNTDQVAPYFDAYMARFRELEAGGQYPYNDSFRGHVPGIEGDCEGAAIYIMQGVRHLNEEHARVAKLRAEGLAPIDNLPARKRFARIALYRPGSYTNGTGELSVYEDARLVPDDQGRPYAVLPKGKRTRGYLVQNAQVLVLA